MKIESKEVHKVINSDRLIYLHKANNKVVGVNYMQGSDDIDSFEDYKNTNKELTKFVLKRLKNHNSIDRIDDLIWLNIDYNDNIEEVIDYSLDYELFSSLSEKFNLSEGGFSPQQHEKLEQIKRQLFELSGEFIEQNT